MDAYRRYQSAEEPAGTIVVKIVRSGDQIRGFIRQVTDPSDAAEESIEQSEEVPVEEAFRLAHNKRANIEGDASVVIELEEGIEWNPAWGRLV